MLHKGHLATVYLSLVPFLNTMPYVLLCLNTQNISVRNVSSSWSLRWLLAVCKKWMWVELVYPSYVIYIHIIITVFLI